MTTALENTDTHIVCSVEHRSQFIETLRGGILMLLRWFVGYPLAYLTYSISGLMRAPWRLAPQSVVRGPQILVVNHTNSAFDVLLSQLASPQWNFFLVDGSRARIPLGDTLLRILRGVPLKRGGNAPLNPENTASFLGRLADLLNQGHSLTAFPEGESRYSSQLRHLRYGVAYIALEAEERSGWQLPLTIQCLGLNYENVRIAGSRCLAQWAEPIDVRRYRELFLKDRQGAQAKLLADVEGRLRDALIEADTPERLMEAHRLAHARREHRVAGVRRALQDLMAGTAEPVRQRGILWRGLPSAVFQLVAFLVFGVIGVLAWPFRAFGRLAARDPSQEICYGLLLWLVCLVSGFFVSDGRWALQFCAFTVVGARSWLWAWRRGMVS